MEQRMRDELRNYYQEDVDNIRFKVLNDEKKPPKDWRTLFVHIHELFGTIDVLFVSSGFWRPYIAEPFFIKLSRKSYLYKMGLHNTIDNIEAFTGILSPKPETEIPPSDFKGDVLLRPAASGVIGSISLPLGRLSPQEQETITCIRQFQKNRFLITFTNNLTGRLEKQYYWLVKALCKHYNNDIGLVLIGKDSVEGKAMIQQNCGTDIAVAAFPFQKNLTRFVKIITQNFQCIYIHPDHSGGGYCKVLAAFLMPTFVFSRTDSVQMHPYSMCSCKEEKLFKCIRSFDNYSESKALIQDNIEHEKHFRKYSKWLLEFIIKG